MDGVEKARLYRAACKHSGMEYQFDILVEEMAELTHAIMKAKRAGITFYTDDVLSEMADVLISFELFEVVSKDLGLWDSIIKKKEEKLEQFYRILIDEWGWKGYKDAI